MDFGGTSGTAVGRRQNRHRRPGQIRGRLVLFWGRGTKCVSNSGKMATTTSVRGGRLPSIRAGLKSGDNFTCTRSMRGHASAMTQETYQSSKALAPVVIYLLSPTWLLAKILKRTCGSKDDRARLIKSLNLVYFLVSVVSPLIIMPILSEPRNWQQFPLLCLWEYFLLSRCNEVFFAFLKDASDKLENRESGSVLTYRDRLLLSLRSYIELIFDFGILFYLFPVSYWKNAPSNIVESLYFSGVTITTLGYGDISPKCWLPQMLSVYEVLCGFVLIIVCFAVYLSKSNTDSK